MNRIVRIIAAPWSTSGVFHQIHGLLRELGKTKFLNGRGRKSVYDVTLKSHEGKGGIPLE